MSKIQLIQRYESRLRQLERRNENNKDKKKAPKNIFGNNGNTLAGISEQIMLDELSDEFENM